MKFFISYLLSKISNFLSLGEFLHFAWYTATSDAFFLNIFWNNDENKKIKSSLVSIPKNQWKQQLTWMFMFDGDILHLKWEQAKLSRIG
jgi:hypothetical protein